MLYEQESKKIYYNKNVNITEDIFTVTPCVQKITAEVLNQSRDRPSSREFCVGSGGY